MVCSRTERRYGSVPDQRARSRADDLGATWRDNSYPGCACDIASVLYSYSDEQNPNRTRAFAHQPEIQAYIRDVAARHGAMPHVRFGHEVPAADWDEDADPAVMRLAERRARAHIERQVADPKLRAKLIPDYRLGCKRVLGSDTWYPALTHDNVDVVTAGIAEVTPDGIVAGDGTTIPWTR